MSKFKSPPKVLKSGLHLVHRILSPMVKMVSNKWYTIYIKKSKPLTKFSTKWTKVGPEGPLEADYNRIGPIFASRIISGYLVKNNLRLFY